MKSNYILKELSESQYNLWDDLVQDSPQGTIFHTSWWLKSVCDATGTTLHLVGIFNGDELIGGCGFSEERHVLLRLAFSPPINSPTPYGGIVLKPLHSSNLKKEESLYYSVLGMLSNYFKENYDYVYILNHPRLVDLRPFKWADWKLGINYTYVLDIQNFESENELFGHFDKSVRWSINKAGKSKVSVHSTEDHFDLVYDLLNKSYVRQNREVPLSKKVLYSLLTELESKGFYRCYFAYENGVPIAFGSILSDGDSAYYWLAGADRSKIDLGGPSIILGEAFCHILKKKMVSIDFVGANNRNVSRFKSAFNPEIYSYYSVEWANTKANLAKKIYGTFMKWWKKYQKALWGRE